ncbi:MAG: helix-turn-helix transcriptional regulator [Rhodomicrobium sp.]
MQPEWNSIVKHYRILYGLSQRDLGLLLGVSQKTISRWESGENKPNLTQQKQFRDVLYKPSDISLDILKVAVNNAPVPRALCFHRNLNLQALSQLRIAKRPSIVNWIGLDLVRIVCGVQAQMLEDRALQRSIFKGEIACISIVSRSSFLTREHATIGMWRSTVSFFRIDGTLFRDSISVPDHEGSKPGYWPLPMDEIAAG